MSEPKDFFAPVSVTHETEVVPQITPEELSERIARLETMARSISEDFAVRVVVGKQPGWRYKFKPIHTIEVDPKDVQEKGINYCFGLIAHESAHTRISRIGFIPKDIWQTTGFSFLFNAIEDPRVNNWVMRKYGGAEEWLRAVYNEDVSPEKEIEKISEEKIGYIPKHIRYGLEVIRYWHTGAFLDDLPDDVRIVLDKTIADARVAYEMIPVVEPSENEIDKRAEGMYNKVRLNIWPEYQKLIETAKDDEKIRQLIKELVERGELEISQNEAEAGVDTKPLVELPEDLRKEIEKRVVDILEVMSDEDREKVLTEAEKLADEALDDLETDLDEALRGRLIEQPETKSEEHKRIIEECAHKDAEKAVIAKRAQIAETLKRVEANKTEYQKTYEEIKPHIDTVVEDLLNIIAVKRFPVFRVGFPGQTLRLKGAMKYKGRRDYSELFEERRPVHRPHLIVELLVDLSGSMRGKKIEETFKGVVLFVEALARVSEITGTVKVSVHGFQDTLISYKNFDQPLDDKLREKMSIIKSEVSNAGWHNRANWNSDGFCVESAERLLSDHPDAERFLIVLSDGQPAPHNYNRVERYQNMNADDELKCVVRDISAAGNTHLLAIGLGPGTDHVARFYPNILPYVENIPNVNVEQLVPVLGEKLINLFAGSVK